MFSIRVVKLPPSSNAGELSLLKGVGTAERPAAWPIYKSAHQLPPTEPPFILIQRDAFKLLEVHAGFKALHPFIGCFCFLHLKYL